MIELFLGESAGLLEEIREYVRRGDAEALYRAAHAFKGSVGNFAADAASMAAVRLETIGRAGDMDQAPGALENLEKELDRLREALIPLASE